LTFFEEDNAIDEIDKTKFDEDLLKNPMLKFVSLFYSQIFIEKLDLSNNVEICEDLAQVMVAYFTKVKVRNQ
jgi:hypothetical protein